MAELSLDLVTEHLGKPVKNCSNRYYWQCPYCMDTGKDNLIYDEQKKVLWCFANNKHSANILKDLFSKGNITKNTYKKPAVNPQPCKPQITKERQEEFFLYMLKCNDELLKDKKALQYLYDKRGIDSNTVGFCGIGIDKIKRRWVFPTFEYGCETIIRIVGFEYRPPDLSKNGMYREKDTPTCMAMVNAYTPDTKALAILEGYLDAYAFTQHLKGQEQLEYYHIATPSNGVSSIIKLIKEIDFNFNNYQKIYVYLDSDDVSKPKMQEIKELYPYIDIKIMTCGCKDFGEHYLRCLKATKLKY